MMNEKHAVVQQFADRLPEIQFTQEDDNTYKFCPEHHPWLAPRGWIHLDEYENTKALERALNRIFWKKITDSAYSTDQKVVITRK